MKINTSTIPGYADMTAEERLAALEAYEFQASAEEESATVKRYKELISKANGEAAEFKKQLRERMSAEEKAAAEREDAAKRAEEEKAETERRIEALVKENTITKLTAKYAALGYSQKMAEETAKAQYEGDTDTVFANMQKHADEREKEILAAAAKAAPKPGGNADGEAQGEDVAFAKKLGERAAKNNVDAAKVLEGMLK